MIFHTRARLFRRMTCSTRLKELVNRTPEDAPERYEGSLLKHTSLRSPASRQMSSGTGYFSQPITNGHARRYIFGRFTFSAPAVVDVAGRYGVPVVQTVHAYRHGCANGVHLRDGHVCTDCVGSRLGLPAVRHGCYRDSRLQTVPVTIGMISHRRTWRRGVARYLALTPFMRDMLVSYGLPAERITVRPTWVVDPGTAGEPGRDVLYVGRLDEAKGIDRLLDAWALARRGGLHPQQRLVIAGDGPLRDLVSDALDVDPMITWLGQVPPDRVAQAMAEASYIVVPSRVFEGYPLAVAEAFGRGRGVLTVSGGSVGSIVDDQTGWVVDPSAEGLARALTSITVEDTRSRGAAARASYERNNTPAAGLASLLAVYDAVSGTGGGGGQTLGSEHG